MSEQAIFLAALDKEPSEHCRLPGRRLRPATRRCGAGVETLLRLHAAPQGFLDVPAVEQLAGASGPDSAATDLSFLALPSEPGALGRLDHYEVLEVVGRGGTGVVLRARDTKLLRVVALKVLAAPLAASGTARRRLRPRGRAAPPPSATNTSSPFTPLRTSARSPTW